MTTRISPLPQLGHWKSLAELTELQDKLLPEALGRAARSPFFAARFGQGPPPADRSDLSALALTSKQDLRDNYPFGLLAVASEDLATYHESSGTAGQPTPSYYTQGDWTDLAERYARKWIGISAADTFLVRTPYALMITGHLAHAAARSRGATVIPGGTTGTSVILAITSATGISDCRCTVMARTGSPSSRQANPRSVIWR
jgi:phenylacetate-CoA ligase